MSIHEQNKPLTLRSLSHKQELLSSGHRGCPGCGAPTIVRQVLMAIDEPVVISNVSGCLEVSTCIFPYTAWKSPWIHSAFENAAATSSGLEAMYRSLRKQGKLKKKMKFIVFGGDGGTYDMGLQSLSGAMERGHQLLYICYDNGACMNTGIHRTSATPFGANTTSDPVGSLAAGKAQRRKDVTRIMAAHASVYAAQASPHNWKDLMTKVRKALATEGPAYMGVISPCNRGWRSRTDDSILLSRLAVETCFWPLYEVQDGKWTINFDPKDRKKPVAEWLKLQGRFKHFFAPGNEELLEQFQQFVDNDWESLRKLQKMSETERTVIPERFKPGHVETSVPGVNMV
jgi:pyruvate ferredoxin oxidoreductase beta subunit